MHIITPFSTLNDGSPTSELLDMIWRKGPLFMRTHLGHTNREQQHLNAEAKREIRREVAATMELLLTEEERRKKFEAIAHRRGVHYSTVIKHTTDIRRAAGVMSDK